MSQLGLEYSPVPCLGLSLGGGPRSPLPAPGLGRWPLSQAHLPVCQQGALNIRELLGRMYRSETPLFKEEPTVMCVSPGSGEPSPGEPRMLASRGSCGRLLWSHLPQETTGKFPREQELVL